MSEALVFAFSLLNTGAALFLIVYFATYNVLMLYEFILLVQIGIMKIITLSDLECDYLNAQQCCSKLNYWILPKFIAHIVLVVLFTVYGLWYLALCNLPFIGWLAYEYFSVPSGNTGVYDPTEIHNRGQLRKHMRNCMIYLGWYLISFFIYLYCMINNMLKDSPLEKDDGEHVSEF